MNDERDKMAACSKVCAYFASIKDMVDSGVAVDIVP